MTTPVPQPDDLPANTTSGSEEPQAGPPNQPGSQPLVFPNLSGEEEEEASPFYSFEDDLSDPGTPLVAPFQLSGAMPTVQVPSQPSGQKASSPSAPSAPKVGRKWRWSLPLIAILVCTVLTLGLLMANVLAQTTPLQTHGTGTPQAAQRSGPPATRPTPMMQPAAVPTKGANGQGQGQLSLDWVPQQLPPGWTNAGLDTADGIQALRTALTFNDREMSLDYRSVGTRTNHAGTFTAATFVMTTAARQRFFTNDIRAINNTLFDTVTTTKLVRLVVNPQPQLVKFAQVGQQQFAWVDVAFQLWQSHIDPNHPTQRIEGKELDPATNQPQIHHMMVLLLRVLSQNAGANPAMGGTGWLVSNYGLDLPTGTTLEIVQPA